MKMKKYEDYRNPDKQCHYLFWPKPAEYCWSYSVAFDNCKTRKELREKTLKLCPGCEFWKWEKTWRKKK